MFSFIFLDFFFSFAIKAYGTYGSVMEQSAGGVKRCMNSHPAGSGSQVSARLGLVQISASKEVHVYLFPIAMNVALAQKPVPP